MRNDLAALTLAAGVALAGLASAQSPVLDRVIERSELRVATSGTQPPFNAISKDGELIGLEVDLARMFADAMNVNLSLTSMPFPDLLPSLERGDVDMVLSGISITPERARTVAFVGPYVLSGKSVLTNGSTLARMKGPRDLDEPGLTLAALADSTSASYVKRVAPRAKLVETQDYVTAIDMIVEGRATALVADMPTCVVAVLRNPGKDLATLSKPLNVEPVGVALSAKDPRFQGLVENLVDAFEMTGLLDELRSRWIEDGAWISLLP